MPDRYPGYDVLKKRHTLSWNEATRRVIDERLAITNEPVFFKPGEWRTLTAICERIVPQPKSRVPVPIAALVDRKMVNNERDGFRHAGMPGMQTAWRRGLAALEAAAQIKQGAHFDALSAREQDALLKATQNGELDNPEWQDMPPATFFSSRLTSDILAAYYTHPTSWSEIGFGGPASPRGYVRMNFNRRDAWEAAEAKPGHEAKARRINEHVG